MPFLIPLSTIAAGSIETLRRGAASAMNWFGIILFSTILFLIWLGWNAMLTGFPQKTYERMQFLAQTNESHFNIFILIWNLHKLLNLKSNSGGKFLIKNTNLIANSAPEKIIFNWGNILLLHNSNSFNDEIEKIEKYNSSKNKCI